MTRRTTSPGDALHRIGRFARCRREEIAVRQSSRAVLRRAFKHLEHEVPDSIARQIRNLRHPHARWVRIPAGVLLILGGVFSILPVLGIWMLPLGLLLIAYDVPILRRPVGRFTIWAARKWAAIKQWLVQRWARG
jgi:hypothetical protein